MFDQRRTRQRGGHFHAALGIDLDFQQAVLVEDLLQLGDACRGVRSAEGARELGAIL